MPRRQRSLSLRSLLAVLVVVFAVALVAVTEFQGARSIDEARDDARGNAAFLAGLAAEEIDDAVAAAGAQVDALAANPGVAAAFEDAEGCTLSFAGIGPFTGGHLDIVDTAGNVVCSSRPLPSGPVHADAPWLGTDGVRTAVIDDVGAGEPALVIAAPVGDVGSVAAFAEVADAPAVFAERFGGFVDVEFSISGPDGLQVSGAPAGDALTGTGSVEALGWTVTAALDDGEVTSGARETRRDTRVLAAAALGFLALAIVALNRLLVGPIRRLDADIDRAMADGGAHDIQVSGPSEVATLAENFQTLSADVASELRRRREAEVEARHAAANLRRLFEANPQSMWVHDRSTGELLMANPAAAQMLGWSERELLAMNVADLLPEDAPEWLSPAGDTGEVSVTRGGPWRFTTRAGDVIDGEITSDVVQFDGRDGRLVVVEDVTAQRRTQRLIEESERMDSLGQLAGGIAHDFNNLLTVIGNYTELATIQLAGIDAPDSVAVADDLAQVASATERAASLTRQLLTFAKGDVSDTAPTDVNRVVGEIVGLLERSLGEHIVISTELADDVPAAVANAAQLEQVLVNLAVNARDAMPSGGLLTFDTAVEELDEGDRPELDAGTYVRIRVSDTGHGMDEATRAQVFEPFFTTKPAGSGTGLGLSTVYGIVTRSGGAVQLYSEPGRGTTVGVLLPATTSTPSTRGQAPPDGVAAGAAARVLLVEDDDSLRFVAERVLERAGFTVTALADGRAALDALAADPDGFDVVVTDAVMPTMLGAELVRSIRELDPCLPVLMMSGHLPRTLDSSSANDRSVPLLAKPFTSTALVEFVCAGLERR